MSMVNGVWIASFAWTCPHCGRHWDTEGHKTGFVKSAAFSHMGMCEGRTPAQRRAENKAAEARWKRNGLSPGTIITNDPKHPGLTDVPSEGGV